jgi:hypothetical protein
MESAMYAKRLKKALDGARLLGEGYSRGELMRRSAAINEQLKCPMSDAERIMLCADRAALRKTLEAL